MEEGKAPCGKRRKIEAEKSIGGRRATTLDDPELCDEDEVPECYLHEGGEAPEGPCTQPHAPAPEEWQEEVQPVKRRRLNQKTRDDGSFAMEVRAAPCDGDGSGRVQNELVTMQVARAAKRRNDVQLAAHTRRAASARTEAWAAIHHEPSAIRDEVDLNGWDANVSAGNGPQLHPSHSIQKSPGIEVIYCGGCGAWTRGTRSKGLSRPCKGRSGRNSDIRLLQVGVCPGRGARIPNELKLAGSRGTRGGMAGRKVRNQARRKQRS